MGISMPRTKAKTKSTAKKTPAKKTKKSVTTANNDLTQRLDEQLRLISETQKALAVVTDLYESVTKQLAETEDDFHERMDKLEARYEADHGEDEDDDVEEDDDDDDLVLDSDHGDGMTAQGHADGDSEYSDPAEDGPIGDKGFSDPDTV